MSKKRNEQRGEQQEPQLPRGVKLLRIVEGHQGIILSVAFDPAGRTLASGGQDGTVKLWDVATGKLLRTLEGHEGIINSVAFDPAGRRLASGSDDGTVGLWDVATGKLLRTLEGMAKEVWRIAFDSLGRTIARSGDSHEVTLWDVATGRVLRRFKGHARDVLHVAFDPAGRTLASGGQDGTVKLWDVATGKLLRTLAVKNGLYVLSVVFNPSGQTLVSGSGNVLQLWDVASGRLLRTLEEHTGIVDEVAFSKDGRFLASKSDDDTLCLWSSETWEPMVVIPELTDHRYSSSLSFHPTLPLLASVGSEIDIPRRAWSEQIHIWELNFNELLGKASVAVSAVRATHHTTAKVVLVGDHSVGKSGLGWRLAHGEFREQASTHGQQFWVLPELGKVREDGTECEAILWDLAGQPDYRLIHALFLDDVDLALVLFDSSDISDPLHGVEFWLKQLKVGKEACCRTLLVGAQADRGTPTLTLEELKEFCGQRGIGGYVSTSAKEGWGVEELVGRMKELIAWEEKPATTTTATFKRIKDFVLRLKAEREEGQSVIVTPEELRGRLEATDAEWRFTDAEMMTAVGHLENYGYVKRLRTSKGEERVLLAPELLNNLAASFVLEARRNPEGLGALEEQRLMAGEYSFAELKGLSGGERDILLDSAALLFLEHNVCFRETDPLGGRSYLVFPELINRKKPPTEDEQPAEDGVAYTVTGAVENVYASLVVLLGYTQTFTRRNQWQNQARYVMADGSVCGFRQEGNEEGALELVLYFGAGVPGPGRKVFEGLFESFLARRNVTIFRYEPVVCPDGHTINRAVVRERLRGEKGFAFCEECGEKAVLRKADEPVRLAQTERRKVEEQRWFAAQRSRFEQAVFQVMSYVEGQKIKRPECFISYAWGDPAHERWVEKSLAADLQKAGLGVVLDRWTMRVGMGMARFVERIEKCDRLIVVGTPEYRRKYENRETSTGYVVAAEVDLISNRLLGTEDQKQSVLPLLLAGEKAASLPPLLHGRVFADFRDERAYFITAFDLILSLYDIAPNDRAVADLRGSLRDSELM